MGRGAVPEKPGKSAFRFTKSIRDGFNVTFSLVRKSNQKVHQRAAKRRCKIAPSGYPGNGSKFRAVNFWLNRKLCAYQEILLEITVLCNIARSILNRCETAVLLRKDLWMFIKRQSLIWVDSRLCVS